MTVYVRSAGFQMTGSDRRAGVRPPGRSGPGPDLPVARAGAAGYGRLPVNRARTRRAQAEPDTVTATARCGAGSGGLGTSTRRPGRAPAWSRVTASEPSRTDCRAPRAGPATGGPQPLNRRTRTAWLPRAAGPVRSPAVSVPPIPTRSPLELERLGPGPCPGWPRPRAHRRRRGITVAPAGPDSESSESVALNHRGTGSESESRAGPGPG